jgi:hypothetical protein
LQVFCTLQKLQKSSCLLCTVEVRGSNALCSPLMKIYSSTVVQVVQVAEVVERELDRLRTACSYPYLHIERAENVLVVDPVCRGSGDA